MTPTSAAARLPSMSRLRNAHRRPSRERKNMGFKTVTPSIWSLNLGIVNCFLLRSTSGYALVDTGFEKAW